MFQHRDWELHNWTLPVGPVRKARGWYLRSLCVAPLWAWPLLHLLHRVSRYLNGGYN